MKSNDVSKPGSVVSNSIAGLLDTNGADPFDGIRVYPSYYSSSWENPQNPDL